MIDAGRRRQTGSQAPSLLIDRRVDLVNWKRHARRNIALLVEVDCPEPDRPSADRKLRVPEMEMMPLLRRVGWCRAFKAEGVGSCVPEDGKPRSPGIGASEQFGNKQAPRAGDRDRVGRQPAGRLKSAPQLRVASD